MPRSKAVFIGRPVMATKPSHASQHSHWGFQANLNFPVLSSLNLEVVRSPSPKKKISAWFIMLEGNHVGPKISENGAFFPDFQKTTSNVYSTCCPQKAKFIVPYGPTIIFGHFCSFLVTFHYTPQSRRFKRRVHDRTGV